MPWATKAMSHNYRACTVEPVLHDKRKHHNEDCIPRNSRVAPARPNYSKAHIQQSPSMAKKKKERNYIKKKEKETAIHSSILAWGIPWTEEPGWLQVMGLQESDTTW